jgi:hypothetical protein
MDSPLLETRSENAWAELKAALWANVSVGPSEAENAPNQGSESGLGHVNTFRGRILRNGGWCLAGGGGLRPCSRNVTLVGRSEGVAVGRLVGSVVGASVGKAVGLSVGSRVGLTLGSCRQGYASNVLRATL